MGCHLPINMALQIAQEEINKRRLVNDYDNDYVGSVIDLALFECDIIKYGLLLKF